MLALKLGFALGLAALLTLGCALGLVTAVADGEPVALGEGEGHPVELGLAELLAEETALQEAQEADGDGLAELLADGWADWLRREERVCDGDGEELTDLLAVVLALADAETLVELLAVVLTVADAETLVELLAVVLALADIVPLVEPLADVLAVPVPMPLVELLPLLLLLGVTVPLVELLPLALLLALAEGLTDPLPLPLLLPVGVLVHVCVTVAEPVAAAESLTEALGERELVAEPLTVRVLVTD